MICIFKQIISLSSTTELFVLYLFISYACIFKYYRVYCSRIKNSEKCCANCIASVCAFESIVAEYTALVRLKEFKIGCLKYVSDKCFKFFLRMEEIFENIDL
jgi:hypothetical protein